MQVSSLHSDDRNRKLSGLRQGLNLLCRRSVGWTTSQIRFLFTQVRAVEKRLWDCDGVKLRREYLEGNDWSFRSKENYGKKRDQREIGRLCVREREREREVARLGPGISVKNDSYYPKKKSPHIKIGHILKVSSIGCKQWDQIGQFIGLWATF